MLYALGYVAIVVLLVLFVYGGTVPRTPKL
jgi:hypothetical protein